MYDLVFDRYPFQNSVGTNHLPHAYFEEPYRPASGWWDMLHPFKDDDTEQDWRMAIHTNSVCGIHANSHRAGYTTYQLTGDGPWGEDGPTVTLHAERQIPANVLRWWPYEGW